MKTSFLIILFAFLAKTYAVEVVNQDIQKLERSELVPINASESYYLIEGSEIRQSREFSDVGERFEWKNLTQHSQWTLKLPRDSRQMIMVVEKNREAVLDTLVFYERAWPENVTNPFRLIEFDLPPGHIMRVEFFQNKEAPPIEKLRIGPTDLMNQFFSKYWFLSKGCFGLLAVFTVCSLILAVVFKFKTFWWFASYLLCFLGYNLFELEIDGFFFPNLISNGMPWRSLFASLLNIAMVGFAFDFFEWRKDDILIKRIVWFLYGLLILNSFCWILFEVPLLGINTKLLFGITKLGLILGVVYEYINGKKNKAFFYLSAEAFLFASAAIWFLYNSGSFKIFDISYVVLFSLGGLIVHIVLLMSAMFHHILSLITTLTRLKEVELKNREGLIRNIRHELRTPLVGLWGELDSNDNLPLDIEGRIQTVSNDIIRLVDDPMLINYRRGDEV